MQKDETFCCSETGYRIPMKRVNIISAAAADEENENSKHKSKNPRNILTFFNEFAEGT